MKQEVRKMATGEVSLADGWAVDLAAGNIKSSYLLDMDGKDIINVRKIIGSANWSLDENGALSVKEVKTEKLCVGSVCVTEEQFKTVFGSPSEAASAQSANSSSSEISSPQSSQASSSSSTSESSSSVSSSVSSELSESSSLSSSSESSLPTGEAGSSSESSSSISSSSQPSSEASSSSEQSFADTSND